MSADRSACRSDRTVMLPWGVDLATFGPARAGGSRREDALGIGGETAGRRHAAVPRAALRGRHRHRRLPVARPNATRRASGRGRRRESDVVADRSGPIDPGSVGRVHFRRRVAVGRDGASILAARDIYVSRIPRGRDVGLAAGGDGRGLSVIVSDIPGNREWVEPGANGERFVDGDAIRWPMPSRSSRAGSRAPPLRTGRPAG